MTFSELLEYCQAEALSNKLAPSEEYIWRQLCRDYSAMFHTPLAEVHKLEVMDVVLNVYEQRYSEVDVDENLEAIMDTIYTLQDPDYAKEKRDDLRDFIKRALRDEEMRLAKGAPIHKAMAKETEVSLPKIDFKDTPPSPDQKIPQSGGINLSYLAGQDSENGGFDDFE